MSSKKKTLCDYKKSDLKDYAHSLASKTPAEIFLCLKCARIADKKMLVCKPQLTRFNPEKEA